MTNTAMTVRHFIQETFFVRDAHALAADVSLLDLGIVDSTGVLELTAFLEATFDFQISDIEIVPENLDSIERIVAFVERRTGAVSGVIAREPELRSA